MESQKRPPTSHWDLLVAKVGRMVGGKSEKTTNKSLGLVGGRGGLHGGGGGGGEVVVVECHTKMQVDMGMNVPWWWWCHPVIVNI